MKFDRTDRPFLARAAQIVTGRVFSESAGLREIFPHDGKTYSPLFGVRMSPLLFLPARASSRTPPRDCERSEFSHLLLKRTSISVDFLRAQGLLPSLEGHLKVVMANPTFVLLELEDPFPPSKPGHE